MRTTNENVARSLFPVSIGIVCVLGAAMTATAITGLTHPAAHLGDIVVFTPSNGDPAAEGTRLIVHRQDRFGCVLDLNIMRRSGGSFIVESRSATGKSLRVHWAGKRTSADMASCGEQADLIIDSEDLDILALAAGGFGAGQKRTPFSAAAFGN